MRSVSSRIYHAVCFELIGFLLVVPLGIVVFGLTLRDIGVVGVVGSLIATVWVYCYNFLFDHALLRLYGSVAKTVTQRIIHSFLFELGLLAVLLPFVALYLDLTLWEALKMDASLAAFYLVYSFVFNWIYDVLFPVEPVYEL